MRMLYENDIYEFWNNKKIVMEKDPLKKLLLVVQSFLLLPM